MVARTVLTVVYVVICIAMVIVVLMQEGKNAGLGALNGGASSDTYWSKNKGRSMEAGLVKITRVLAALFFIISLALNMKW